MTPMTVQLSRLSRIVWPTTLRSEWSANAKSRDPESQLVRSPLAPFPENFGPVLAVRRVLEKVVGRRRRPSALWPLAMHQFHVAARV